MTREEIAKSLKPIQWIYKHEFCCYVADLGVGGVNLRIEPQTRAPDKPYLIAKRGRDVIFDRSKPFGTLDEAMGAARDIQIDEVCNLFDLTEQN